MPSWEHSTPWRRCVFFITSHPCTSQPVVPQVYTAQVVYGTSSSFARDHLHTYFLKSPRRCQPQQSRLGLAEATADIFRRDEFFGLIQLANLSTALSGYISLVFCFGMFGKVRPLIMCEGMRDTLYHG